MKKIAIGMFALLVLASAAFAQKATKPDGSTITIGFTFHSSQDVFQNIVKNAFVDAAKARGVEVKVIDPQMDIGKQLEAIDTFISLKVDAIVCAPLDDAGIVPGVLEANKAGIPFIAVNGDVSQAAAAGGQYTYVGSQHYDSGAIEGAYMAKVLKKGAKILYLRGSEGMSHAIARRQGIQDKLLNVRPDVVLLAEQTANYDRTQAMKVTEDWLQEFPQVDAVIAANDQMALGALEAMKGAKRDKGVLFAGIDGTTEALQDIKAGVFAISVLQDAKGQSSGALEAAIQILNKKPVAHFINIPYVGITKENLSQYLK